MSSSPPSHSPSSSSSNAPLPGLKEQWSQLNELLPPSSDDNQIVSTSSPLLLKVSAMLHDRLSHFERNKWPLDRIYEFLDSFFKSHPNLHHRSPQSKQVADPTTPVKPTSALPQQALENTPRTSKATSLLAQLRRIEDWDFLISFHKMACDMYSRDKSWSPGQLSLMVDRLIKHQSKFCAVIPELKNVFNDVTTPVVDQLATVYNNLTSRFPTFNSPDQALAVVIVHLAQSHVKHSRDPEVIGTSIHLENGFYRPYCGDAPNCFLTFVSHLNAVYDKLDANEPQPYFRGTPIVQSSGTGKTRYRTEGSSPLRSGDHFKHQVNTLDTRVDATNLNTNTINLIIIDATNLITNTINLIIIDITNLITNTINLIIINTHIRPWCHHNIDIDRAELPLNGVSTEVSRNLR
ncbi:hypothetical protein NDA12_000676 [Ustilago hordei]|nr:hypothetical protein NDA12_000676 [Ustilago hordei]